MGIRSRFNAGPYHRGSTRSGRRSVRVLRVTNMVAVLKTSKAGFIA